MINYCHCQNLVNYSNDVLKSRNKTNNQENSAACSLALVEQTINRPEDNNNVFKTQIRCLEIMIIIVYITVYLELCNCVILINLLVYMQNNCLLFNLYYIYITFLHLIMQCFSQKNCLYLHCINVFVVNKKSLSIKMISFLIDLFVGRI